MLTLTGFLKLVVDCTTETPRKVAVELSNRRKKDCLDFERLQDESEEDQQEEYEDGSCKSSLLHKRAELKRSASASSYFAKTFSASRGTISWYGAKSCSSSKDLPG